MSGKNLVRKEFDADGTWICPGGVTQIRASVSVLAFSQIAAGTDCAFGVLVNGDAYGWGANANGQVGDATVVAKSSPVLITGAFRWRQVAASSATTGDSVFAISNDGGLYSWGLNTSGQLGLNDVVARSTPSTVPGGLKFRQVSAGSANAVAIETTGAAYAWGTNANGEIGDGTVVAKSTPTLVLGSHVWTRVVAGNRFTLGIDSAGALWAWGQNTDGELGVGDVVPRSSPVAVLGGRTWKTVAAGAGHVIAIDSLNNLYAWGANVSGQLGLGDVVPRSSPVAVLGGLKWRYLSAANATSLAIDSTGSAYAWGINANGQLGTNDVTPRSSPVAVVGGLKWRQVSIGGAAGTGMAMGIASTGFIYTWGANNNGQLASGNTTTRSSPVLYNGITYLPSPAVYQIEGNSVLIDVIPNTTYQVTVFGAVAMFNYIGLYQDGQNNTALPLRVTLEYQG